MRPTRSGAICCRRELSSRGGTRCAFARDEAELDELLRLRYEIFNLELGEGLDASHATGRDLDEFDAVCHHLIVVERASERIIGTYRLQTSAMASSHIGFYSDAELDLSQLGAAVLDNAVELGRACIALEHPQHPGALLAVEGPERGTSRRPARRYLFGCCSLTSQDPAEGWAVMEHLERGGQVHPHLCADARPGFTCARGAPFRRPRQDPQALSCLPAARRPGCAARRSSTTGSRPSTTW